MLHSLHGAVDDHVLSQLANAKQLGGVHLALHNVAAVAVINRLDDNRPMHLQLRTRNLQHSDDSMVSIILPKAVKRLPSEQLLCARCWDQESKHDLAVPVW